MRYFDVIIFIKAKKEIRAKRFKINGGDKKLFTLLNSKQLSDKKIGSIFAFWKWNKSIRFNRTLSKIN